MGIKKKIILTGMTGVGKTTIGKMLSKKLEINFYDIDSEIERITKLKIKDFFKIYGEDVFRDLEKKTMIRVLEKKSKSIISPGGGVFMNDELRNKLLKNCICIFLDANIKTLISRLKKNLLNRPKLSKGKLEDNLKEMYIERIENYKKSQIIVNVNEKAIPVIISEIINSLKNYDESSHL